MSFYQPRVPGVSITGAEIVASVLVGPETLVPEVCLPPANMLIQPKAGSK